MRQHILFILFFLVLCHFTTSAREIYNINREWKFFSSSEASSDNAQIVNLPHIWNNDALGGKRDYFRGISNYIKDVTAPLSWQNKRVFIKSYGANSVANVFVNGRHVGEHRGGYTAFAYDITEYLKFGQVNTLWIMVNNSPQMDVLPIAGDANAYGGLFRDVEIIITGKEVISLTDSGSDGIYVVQKKVNHRSADLEFQVKINGINDQVVNAEVALMTESLDTVAVKSARVRLNGRATSTTTIPMTIDNPILWSGVADPYLYKVGVKVINNDTTTDSLVITTGLRSVGYDQQGKFLLNGEPYPIKGVIITQDRAMVGTALTDYQVREDFKLIVEMGANAVRVAGVPHHPEFYRLCDNMGLLVYNDFPVVGGAYLTDKAFIDTETYRENGKKQATEIIRQLFNHPSIVMWGLFSNLDNRGDNPIEFISNLSMLVKREDPSRLTAATSSEDGDLNFITDLIVWDHFFGWEKGQPSDIGVWAKQLRTEWKDLHSGVSYSAGASIYHQDDSLHRPDYLGSWHPERWQTHLHEEYLNYLKSDNQFWGIFVGNMFDYGASGRTWGEGKGINDCGLVTFDRRYCKDAYYFYKANWFKEGAFVYISERRWDARRNPIQNIRVYSNTEEVELFINGTSHGKHKGDNGLFLWSEIELNEGFNIIEAESGAQRDSAIIEIISSKSGKKIM